MGILLDPRVLLEQLLQVQAAFLLVRAFRYLLNTALTVSPASRSSASSRSF